MQPEVLALLLSLCAGMSTTVGALLPFIFKLKQQKFLGMALSLSAGVMVFVSFDEILPEAKETFEKQEEGTFFNRNASGMASLFFFLGVLGASGLGWLLHRLDHDHDHEPIDLGRHQRIPQDEPDMEMGSVSFVESLQNQNQNQNQSQSQSQPPTFPSLDSRIVTVSFLQHPITWIKQDWAGFSRLNLSRSRDAEKLHRTGIMAAVAIAIHNFPEGLATFVGTLASPKVGVSLAVAIAIHNIPEGICVAMPIYFSTGSRLKGFSFAFISGISEPIGALLGWSVIALTNESLTLGILFGVVAGMMVFISVKELLPTARQYDMHDQFTTFCFVFGMAVMALSLALFDSA